MTRRLFFALLSFVGLPRSCGPDRPAVTLGVPEYGGCSRCRRKWCCDGRDDVKGANVNYSASEAMFAICMDCWDKLSPTERWFYYEATYLDWVNRFGKAFDKTEFLTLRRNVLAGRRF